MHHTTLPPLHHVQGDITLPGSKSLTNRALLLASLSVGTTRLHNLLDSDDTRYMREALAQIGIKMTFSEDFRTCDVVGCGGIFPLQDNLSLFLGNAGTAMRFLTATLCLKGTTQKEVQLSGVPRMHQRPIGHLVDALRQAGGDIRYMEQENFPPLRVKNTGLKGGKITLDGSISSQFLTALLMISPYFEQETEIEILGECVSKPYVEMTIKMMATFGVVVKPTPKGFFIPAQQTYQSPKDYFVEGDASSASYFLSAGALGGRVKVCGIGKESLQGDSQFAEVLAKMGAKITYGENWIQAERGTLPLQGIDFDANAIPDCAMTIATTALFAQGESCIRNIANWRVKETDRLKAMATELQKLGATVEEGRDYLRIQPLPPTHFTPQPIHTYDDHRIAMCFALTAFSGKPVTLLNADCVNKTFPRFFEEWAKIRK